jgi:hypothetical protein
MPVEEITIGLLGLLARAVGWIFVEIIFYVVCFSIGWAEMKILTLGKYPTDTTSKNTPCIIGVCNLLFLLIGFTIYAS